MKNIATEILSKENWFEHWFDTSFYHKLYANRDEEEAKAFVDELILYLQPGSNACMLDLGCGNGRHSKHLAAKGFYVIGIDLAASSIREAKKFRQHSLHFYTQDMRERFGTNVFDYIFNFFTSFGYFKDAEDDNKVIENMSTALKPGGTLVMDYINTKYAAENLKASGEKEIDGIVYSITRWCDETHFYKKIVIEETLFGKPLEYVEQVKKFSVSDFECMFKQHQLQLKKVFGDYSLNEYDENESPRMILIAEKCK
ncbi:MAG: class I SAM-dependent methyltransferase [Parafilimonas sp.]|nr:class I SAM-dependent methyltransferase [Parafilimonas sp.]